jgi:hypothetical protein
MAALPVVVILLLRHTHAGENERSYRAVDSINCQSKLNEGKIRKVGERKFQRVREINACAAKAINCGLSRSALPCMRSEWSEFIEFGWRVLT